MRRDMPIAKRSPSDALKSLRRPIAGGALAAAALALLPGCSGNPRPAPRSVTFLTINDVYRIEGVEGATEGGLSRVRQLRRELEKKAPDLLFLHAGDLLFPSLPSRLYKGEQMIDVLNLLDGDAKRDDDRMLATFGNHEFDKEKLRDAAMLAQRIEESQFRWLASDIEWAAGERGEPRIAASNLVRSALLTSGGVRVGLFSLTTDEKHPAYIASFRDRVATARERTARLRAEGAELVVALTHLAIAQDKAVLRSLGPAGPDLIVGGHEHNRLREKVRGRWIIKADAEARTAAEIRVTPRRRGPPRVSTLYHDLSAQAATDPAVDARVESWLSRFDREYCASIEKSSGCLGEVVGQTRVALAAEELEIRRFETNYGNWIADMARQAYATEGAQIAVINSGGLRLNQDIPAGPIRLEHIEETFQYPSALVLLKITGETLQKIVSHAVTDWTGNGKWLQISGFAFRHQPDQSRASSLTLLTPEGPRPIAPDDEILAVTVDFLAHPETGQDGYTMITRAMHVPTGGKSPELRQLVLEGLKAAEEEGIAPQIEGRICNPTRSGPCLAV